MNSGNFSAFWFPRCIWPSPWSFAPCILKPVFGQVCDSIPLQITGSVSLSLSPPYSASSCCLNLHKVQSLSLQVRKTAEFCSDFLSLFCCMETASRHLTRAITGLKPHLFPFSQGSQTCIACCPKFKKKLFPIFCPIFYAFSLRAILDSLTLYG